MSKLVYNILMTIIIGGCIINSALLLNACNEAELKQHHMDFSVGEMSSQMHYYKDKNTNLCFAAMNLSMQSATMTNVPCTPEVEKMAHSFTSESK